MLKRHFLIFIICLVNAGVLLSPGSGAQNASLIDTDNDGVFDDVDLDNDNDGIADLEDGFVSFNLIPNSTPIRISGAGSAANTRNGDVNDYRNVATVQSTTHHLRAAHVGWCLSENRCELKCC